MFMDKRTLLAFALSFLILFAWSVLFGPKMNQTHQKQKAPVTKGAEHVAPPLKKIAPPPVPAPVASKEVLPKEPLHISKKEILVETPLYKAIFSNVGPTITSFKLKKYRQTVQPDSPPVEMISLKKRTRDFLLFSFGPQSKGNEASLIYEANRDAIQLHQGASPESLIFHTATPSGLLITQTYRFYPERYKIDLQVQVENLSQHITGGAFQTRLSDLPLKGEEHYYSYTGLMTFSDGKMKEIKIKKASQKKMVSGKIGWFAYENGYFMSAVAPETPIDASFTGGMLKSGVLTGRFQTPPVKLGPSDKISARYIIYIGPHELAILKGVGKNLDKAVNFGWTDIIARPLLYLLRFFYRYVHNYGVAIILLTILIKILFWPLTHKSYKSMKEMQKLQPMLAKLREKYKDNKEQMNKEMMALYKTYKVNPMGGCLPMIIQIPVFFALYRILGDSIELRHAPFCLWMNDLSAPDRLFHFAFKIPFMSPPYGIPVLTLLMGVSMFIQQKMTPTPGDPSQAKIMMFLPIIFTVMFINFPSGLVLYWLVNNILSIGQQYRIHKGSA